VYDLEPSGFVAAEKLTTVHKVHNQGIVELRKVTFLPLYLLAQTHDV
jgi:hypothetical protein